jgi:ABC-type nitrate/sulfonate/bicarbonate transport system permease component
MFLRRLTPWLLPAAILVAREIASRSGLLSVRILPEPAAVLAAFWKLLRSGELTVPLPRPRSRTAVGFAELEERVLRQIVGHPVA